MAARTCVTFTTRPAQDVPVAQGKGAIAEKPAEILWPSPNLGQAIVLRTVGARIVFGVLRRRDKYLGTGVKDDGLNVVDKQSTFEDKSGQNGKSRRFERICAGSVERESAGR